MGSKALPISFAVIMSLDQMLYMYMYIYKS